MKGTGLHRDQRAARNFAVLRKIAVNLVGRDRSAKASVRAKRKKAAWNDPYMQGLRMKFRSVI
jgi:hypothetical protein